MNHLHRCSPENISHSGVEYSYLKSRTFYFSCKGKILKNIPPHKNWSQGAREQLRAHGALQRIGSQHSCLEAHSCLALQLQEVPRPLLASMSPCTYMYTPTHRHAHIDITKNRKIKSNKTPVNQKQSETNILFSLLGVKSILICLLRRKNFKNIFNAFVCVSVWGYAHHKSVAPPWKAIGH